MTYLYSYLNQRKLDMALLGEFSHPITLWYMLDNVLCTKVDETICSCLCIMAHQTKRGFAFGFQPTCSGTETEKDMKRKERYTNVNECDTYTGN